MNQSMSITYHDSTVHHPSLKMADGSIYLNYPLYPCAVVAQAPGTLYPCVVAAGAPATISCVTASNTLKDDFAPMSTSLVTGSEYAYEEYASRNTILATGSQYAFEEYARSTPSAQTICNTQEGVTPRQQGATKPPVDVSCYLGLK